MVGAAGGAVEVGGERLGERILVTGGAGFLGSHLCDWLLERGHDVLCVDNFYTGNKKNLKGLLGQLRTSR